MGNFSGYRPRPQTEIRFPIEPRTDKYGDTYYLGWTDAPVQLDMNNCAFFIFLGDDPEVCIRRRQDIRDTRGSKRQRTNGPRQNGNAREPYDEQKANYKDDDERGDEDQDTGPEYEEEELD
jgi:hypothetical protein